MLVFSCLFSFSQCFYSLKPRLPRSATCALVPLDKPMQKHSHGDYVSLRFCILVNFSDMTVPRWPPIPTINRPAWNTFTRPFWIVQIKCEGRGCDALSYQRTSSHTEAAGSASPALFSSHNTLQTSPVFDETLRCKTKHRQFLDMPPPSEVGTTQSKEKVICDEAALGADSPTRKTTNVEITFSFSLLGPPSMATLSPRAIAAKASLISPAFVLPTSPASATFSSADHR